MKLTRFILILIAGLAIMGFNTTGFALEEETSDYMVEEFEPEAEEQEELLVEPEYEAGSIEEYEYLVEEFEPEAELMEEDEYLVDEETVKPVKGEGWDEHDIPELY